MDSFEEFKTFIRSKSFILPVKTKKLLYLVTYPDKLEWDYGVEKQTQMTYLQMSGGGTGAGTGHYIKLCKQSEVSNLLKEETKTTHVMICSVGMIFVVIGVAKGKPDTPITDFEKFSESKIYCKAHIIAKKINLKTQNLIGGVDGTQIILLKKILQKPLYCMLIIFRLMEVIQGFVTHEKHMKIFQQK
jgi:hypothetical protein